MRVARRRPSPSPYLPRLLMIFSRFSASIYRRRRRPWNTSQSKLCSIDVPFSEPGTHSTLVDYPSVGIFFFFIQSFLAPFFVFTASQCTLRPTLANTFPDWSSCGCKEPFKRRSDCSEMDCNRSVTAARYSFPKGSPNEVL